MIAATIVSTRFRPENVGDPSEDDRAEDRRAGRPTRLGGREVPLDGDERDDGTDHEEVAGVGEEANPRDQDCSVVKSTDRRIVEQAADGDLLARLEAAALGPARTMPLPLTTDT